MVIQNTLQHKIGVAASLQEFIAQCGMGPHKAHLLDNERILFFYVILQYNLSDIVENVKDLKNYVERIDEMIERKRIGMEKYLPK